MADGSHADPVSGSDGRKSLVLGGCLLLIFTGVGLLGVVAVAIDWVQGLETWSWEPASCTIEQSQAIARPEYGDYLFDVEYSFSWGGSRRVGYDFRHGYTGSEDEASARILASRYPVGAAISCWVDPEDPRDSALLRANLWEGLWIFVPLLFVAVGSGALWLLRNHESILGPQAADTGPSPDLQSSRGPVERKGAFKKTGILAGFFGIFFLVGTGIFIPFFVWPVLKVVEARSWDEIECEILESAVRTHAGDDGDTFSILVLFRYEIEGREYLSDRYHFLGGSSGGYADKAERVADIPAGTRTACYVNPEDPFEAVLERDFSPEFLFGLIPLVFVLVGAGGLFTVLSTARAARRAAAGPAWLAPARSEEPRHSNGAVTLDPTFGPLGKLLGTTFLALLWNGLVSVFVWHLISAWRTGDRDWLLALFLTPFILIGLLLAAGIPYAILALANPRPRLRLSRGSLRPGESVQVEWSFRGFARRISRLTIRLEGFSSDDLTGDSSRNRSRIEPLTTIDIADRRRGQGLEFGAASFTVPEEITTAASPADEEITWKLKLHGDIAYWPDVDEEFEITVLEPGED